MNIPFGWKNRVLLHRTFFINTLKTSIPVGIASALLGTSTLNSSQLAAQTLLIFFYKCLWFIPTVGLILEFIYKEFTFKEKYFFYYNKGINKTELWSVSFCLTTLVCFILFQIVQIWISVWK